MMLLNIRKKWTVFFLSWRVNCSGFFLFQPLYAVFGCCFFFEICEGERDLFCTK